MYKTRLNTELGGYFIVDQFERKKEIMVQTFVEHVCFSVDKVQFMFVVQMVGSGHTDHDTGNAHYKFKF